MQDASRLRAAAAASHELLPKQQHQLVSRLPRQHDCVDYHGHGGFWGSTCGQSCERELDGIISRLVGADTEYTRACLMYNPCLELARDHQEHFPRVGSARLIATS
jgi:hypothetical protein